MGNIVYRNEPRQPDFMNAVLDFSFAGRVKARFKIKQKGDEMWIGVASNVKYLEERHSWERAPLGQWAYYGGRSNETYVLKEGDDGQLLPVTSWRNDSYGYRSRPGDIK